MKIGVYDEMWDFPIFNKTFKDTKIFIMSDSHKLSFESRFASLKNLRKIKSVLIPHTPVPYKITTVYRPI